MSRPVIIDLYCGGGGAGEGYHRAGCDVIGVDIAPQIHYPFEFHQGDAIEVALQIMSRRRVDAIHASPPCQLFSPMAAFGNGKRGRVDLIPQTRAFCQASGLPYIIENVPRAPLVDAVQLCGSMFGLGVWRHRAFECGGFFPLRPHCQHQLVPHPIVVAGDHPQGPGERQRRIRRARTLAEGQAAMGIDWLPWRPLAQAIPPAFTEHLGVFLVDALRQVRPA